MMDGLLASWDGTQASEATFQCVDIFERTILFCFGFFDAITVQ